MSLSILTDLNTGRLGTGFSVSVKPKYLTVPFLLINESMFSRYHCFNARSPIGFALNSLPSSVYIKKQRSSSLSPSTKPLIVNSPSTNFLTFIIRLSRAPHL